MNSLSASKAKVKPGTSQQRFYTISINNNISEFPKTSQGARDSIIEVNKNKLIKKPGTRMFSKRSSCKLGKARSCVDIKQSETLRKCLIDNKKRFKKLENDKKASQTLYKLGMINAFQNTISQKFIDQFSPANAMNSGVKFVPK